jgi:hypothetical protein
MAQKKDDQPVQLTEEEALIERVDAMLDPKRPDAPVQVASSKDDQPPPLDIFKDVPDAPTGTVAVETKSAQKNSTEPPSAPPLPGKPKKQTMASTEPAVTKTEITEPEQPRESPALEDVPAENIPETSIIDGADNDTAVDDIVANEADTVLAVEDAKLQREATKVASEPHPHHFLRGIMTTLLIVLAVGMFLVIYLTVTSLL